MKKLLLSFLLFTQSHFAFAANLDDGRPHDPYSSFANFLFEEPGASEVECIRAGFQMFLAGYGFAYDQTGGKPYRFCLWTGVSLSCLHAAGVDISEENLWKNIGALACGYFGPKIVRHSPRVARSVLRFCQGGLRRAGKCLLKPCKRKKVAEKEEESLDPSWMKRIGSISQLSNGELAQLGRDVKDQFFTNGVVNRDTTAPVAERLLSEGSSSLDKKGELSQVLFHLVKFGNGYPYRTRKLKIKARRRIIDAFNSYSK